ncbi:MAG: hypothetical protein HYS14_08580 [Candidatus Rokubacteria bacterium]|nr:hypothetical protein [Candidatus Rokubacteria bacterium]
MRVADSMWDKRKPSSLIAREAREQAEQEIIRLDTDVRSTRDGHRGVIFVPVVQVVSRCDFFRQGERGQPEAKETEEKQGQETTVTH